MGLVIGASETSAPRRGDVEPGLNLVVRDAIERGASPAGLGVASIQEAFLGRSLRWAVRRSRSNNACLYADGSNGDPNGRSAQVRLAH